MTVSVREVGGLDCIGPGLTMTQWMNRMMLQSKPAGTSMYNEVHDTMTQNYHPSSNVSFSGHFLLFFDFLDLD